MSLRVCFTLSLWGGVSGWFKKNCDVNLSVRNLVITHGAIFHCNQFNNIIKLCHSSVTSGISYSDSH